jgi:hypothetical protein
LVKLKDLIRCKDLIGFLMGQIKFIMDLIGEKTKFGRLIWNKLRRLEF